MTEERKQLLKALARLKLENAASIAHQPGARTIPEMARQFVDCALSIEAAYVELAAEVDRQIDALPDAPMFRFDTGPGGFDTGRTL